MLGTGRFGLRKGRGWCGSVLWFRVSAAVGTATLRFVSVLIPFRAGAR